VPQSSLENRRTFTARDVLRPNSCRTPNPVPFLLALSALLGLTTVLSVLLERVRIPDMIVALLAEVATAEVVVVPILDEFSLLETRVGQVFRAPIRER
jgi:hypothetical protein